MRQWKHLNYSTICMTHTMVGWCHDAQHKPLNNLYVLVALHNHKLQRIVDTRGLVQIFFKPRYVVILAFKFNLYFHSNNHPRGQTHSTLVSCSIFMFFWNNKSTDAEFFVFDTFMYSWLSVFVAS